jgi:hypothetical protein
MLDVHFHAGEPRCLVCGVYWLLVSGHLDSLLAMNPDLLSRSLNVTIQQNGCVSENQIVFVPTKAEAPQYPECTMHNSRAPILLDNFLVSAHFE